MAAVLAYHASSVNLSDYDIGKVMTGLIKK